jgi:hypothetical protein
MATMVTHTMIGTETDHETLLHETHGARSRMKARKLLGLHTSGSKVMSMLGLDAESRYKVEVPVYMCALVKYVFP